MSFIYPEKDKRGKECKMLYGNYGRERSEENPRDLVDDLKIRIGYKLVKGFNMSDDRE